MYSNIVYFPICQDLAQTLAGYPKVRECSWSTRRISAAISRAVDMFVLSVDSLHAVQLGEHAKVLGIKKG